MKLEFCKLSEEHLGMVRNWRISPEVSGSMYTDPKITPEHQKKWYEEIKKDPTKKYWIVGLNGEYVGVVCLLNIDLINKRCLWAYYLGETSARGKGVGKQIELNILSYVFDDLKLNKLCYEVLAFNDLVVKIHQKYGAKIEGVLRQHIYKNGEFYDVIVMGILKEEWDKIKEKMEFTKIRIE